MVYQPFEHWLPLANADTHWWTHREHGLPLAKALDEEGRLRVVDADMEPHQVGAFKG